MAGLHQRVAKHHGSTRAHFWLDWARIGSFPKPWPFTLTSISNGDGKVFHQLDVGRILADLLDIRV